MSPRIRKSYSRHTCDGGRAANWLLRMENVGITCILKIDTPQRRCIIIFIKNLLFMSVIMERAKKQTCVAGLEHKMESCEKKFFQWYDRYLESYFFYFFLFNNLQSTYIIPVPLPVPVLVPVPVSVSVSEPIPVPVPMSVTIFMPMPVCVPGSVAIQCLCLCIQRRRKGYA